MSDRHFVYVLESVRDPSRHYVGLASDVTARLVEHNSGKTRHTSKHRPWRVLVAVEFGDRAQAATFERYLKSGSGRAFAKRHF